MKSGIYTITNTTTGCVYVGSTNDFTRRWKEHRHDLRHLKHGNRYLQSAWNKYGELSFEFVIVERCSVDLLIKREQVHLENLKGIPGVDFYNLSPISNGSSVSEDGRLFLSVAAMGNSYALGYTHTDEARAKIAAANKGRRHSEDSKIKMRLAATLREADTRRACEAIVVEQPEWLKAYNAKR